MQPRNNAERACPPAVSPLRTCAKGAKMSSSFSPGMPIPVSCTDTDTVSPAEETRASTQMSPCRQAGRQAGGQTARQGRGENRPGGWVGHAQHVPREGLQADTRLQRCGRLPSSSTPAAPAAHPQPVSPPDQTSLTLSVNLHALPMRLYSTCTMRLVSPTTCGPGQAGQQATWQTEGAR